ncbi:hypothetical protein NAS2_1651 [Conexivisphaera calida]|uniref:50S ribosomal protein L35Ae n=2 Tax=Conexivisphaera calida TaxID=1874277 RepID=A0A4P2VFT8_9ARCH|nr:hypothetical protein NAS2_1651 [Conexivisphaera calida]
MGPSMRAIIVGYRRGPGKIYQDVALVRVLSWDRSTDLRGWNVVAVDAKGNRYEGIVIRRHGNGDVVRVRFKPNLPGQMIGHPVDMQPGPNMKAN